MNKYEALVLIAAVLAFLVILVFGVSHGFSNANETNSTCYITPTTTLEEMRDCFRD